MVDRVRANGIELANLSEGNGPLVLLLHGFPDAAHTWDRAMPELAKAGFRVVAPDSWSRPHAGSWSSIVSRGPSMSPELP